MRKLITILLVLAIMLACCTAYAIELPDMTISAKPIDYVSALAGIAKPVSKTYAENERYAVLVTVDVPTYRDTSQMHVAIKPTNCTVDDGKVELKSGKYILYGTVLMPGASIKITLVDDAITQAGTPGDLWRAIDGDRTISATAYMGVQSAAPGAAITIPQTGGASAALAVILCGAAGIAVAKRRRW